MAPPDLCNQQKRRREGLMAGGSDHLSNLQAIVNGMNQAVTKEQRMAVIGNARAAFDHNIPELHDVEVESGLVHALCIQLGYVLNTHSENRYSGIEGLCCVLQLIYRCRDSVRESSFHEVGEELLPLLLKSLEGCEYTAGENEKSQLLVIHVSKILRSFSRSRSVSLIMVKSYDLLTALVTLSCGEKNTEPRIEALSTLKNITFYAEDYRSMILDHDGLLDSVLSVCLYDLESECRVCASAILRNIAFDLGAKIKMAKNGHLLNVTMKICRDCNVKTKRNAVSTIASLTLLNEYSFLFVTHCDGGVVDMLAGLVKIDDDPTIRRRATRTLRCLCHDDTVEILIDRMELIGTLSNAAMSDSCEEVRVEAVKALATYTARLPEPLNETSMAMVDLMINLSKNANPSGAEAIAEALTRQAAYPMNRFPLMERKGIIEALTKITCAPSSTVAARKYSCCALRDLSCETRNRQKIACNSVLTSMVKVASINDEANLKAQEYAIKILVNLVAEATNRKRMAHQQGLLSVLIQYAASSNNNTIKDEVKQAVIDLVPVL